MARLPSSAIGIDLGRHAMKAVLLQRKGGNRTVVTRYATRELPTSDLQTVDALAGNLKALVQELGGSAKACAITVSHADAFIRIIDQPTMPRETMRDALRFNSQTLLNQDCREYVLDCDLVPVPPGECEEGSSRYLVGGLPRMKVQLIHEACMKAKLPTTTLQLAPLAIFNAFEYSHEEVFHQQGFILVDIGHLSSEVIVGAKGEMILVRTLDYGGKHFEEELICHGATGPEEIAQHLAEEEVLTVENARLSLTELVRSISSSIGFVEARRDQSVPRVYVSGGMAKAPVILKVLTEELQLPCEVWNPFSKSDVNLSGARKEQVSLHWPELNAAFGAAAEVIREP